MNIDDILMPFQREGRDFLRSKKKALLADDMGLGKTIQVLAALTGQPCLVICPPSAVTVWERECKRFRQDYKPLACDKLTRFPTKNELMVLSYTCVPTHPLYERARARREAAKESLHLIAWDKPKSTLEDLMAPKVATAKWDGMERGTQLVVDEGHLFKNRRAARTEDIRVFAKTVAGVWVVTGTPILSYASDLWEVLSLAPGLAEEAFGTWDNFRTLYGGIIVEVPGKHGKNCPRHEKGWCNGCKKALQWLPPPLEYRDQRRDAFNSVAIQRFKRHVLPQFPEETTEYVDVPFKVSDEGDEFGLSQADIEEIEALYDSIGRPDEWGIDRICASPSTVEFKTLSAIRASLAASRVSSVMEIINQFENAGEPLVVFSAHRAIVDVIGKRKGWAKLAGDVARKRRDTFVDAFQAGRKKGIAATIQSAGVGITLTKACSVLFIDRDWTPALNRQAKDRVARIGQTRGIRIIIMRSQHPVDQLVEKVLARKELIETETYMLEGAWDGKGKANVK